MQAQQIEQNNLAAVGLMSSAMLFIPLMDIIAKYLSTSLPPLEITFGRFFSQLILATIAILVVGRWSKLLGNRPLINLLRGTFLALASLFFFTAVKYMSVATAISIFFVEPMILTVLAVVFLKEKIGMRRIGAILVGFLGALIILRPSFLEVGLVSLMPLATATLFAGYLLLSRMYASSDGLLPIQFSAGLAGTVILGTALLATTSLKVEGAEFILPDPWQLGLLAMIGAVSYIGHGLVVMAFQRGEAGLLAPLQYLEIVSATLFGYLVFSDFPDSLTWIGIGLIIASGLYIAHRERVQPPAES